MNQPQESRLPSSQKADLSERRSATMAAALRAMVRDQYQSQFGHQVDEGELDLTVTFSVNPSNGWEVQFKQPLSTQLQPQLEAYEAATQAFQAGQVYCYQCTSAQCDHSRGPGVMDVFAGYHQLGTPQWVEYTQFLLGIRDERVDRLFGDRPRVVAKVLDGDFLRSRQFAFFGKSSKTFAVSGQVVAGYFSLAAGSPQSQKVALCFQVVETRNANRQPQFQLHMLIPGPQPQQLQERLDQAFPWIRQACLGARRQLHKMGTNRVGQKPQVWSPFAIQERVRKILARLASDLERGARKTQRQTQHAKIRAGMARPIHKAMADLREARPERMYRDLKTEAIMVCGQKGRCHAFNESGHHITSFVIHGEAIHARVRKKRWARLHPDQSQQFLSSFRNTEA